MNFKQLQLNTERTAKIMSYFSSKLHLRKKYAKQHSKRLLILQDNFNCQGF